MHERTAAPGRAPAPPASLRAHGAPLGTALRALRRILGMPDYAAYLAHLRSHHPDRPVPSEREFYDDHLRARYAAGPTRCC
jgi:uncharacterized short protein YbdD (DUF466 family)